MRYVVWIFSRRYRTQSSLSSSLWCKNCKQPKMSSHKPDKKGVHAAIVAIKRPVNIVQTDNIYTRGSQ